jgi:hypothetical protein
MNIPLPNQQPTWLNTPGVYSDSTANQSDSSAIDSNSGRNIYVDLNRTPEFFNVSWVPNPAPGITIPIVCQKHRATIRETITIHIDGTPDETYCLACIRDLLKERLLPVNQTPLTPDEQVRVVPTVRLENVRLENTQLDMSQRSLLGTLSMGSFSLNIGQEHCPVHNTVDEFISFSFGGREEKYCMRCVRDLLRERLIPLGEEYVPPPIEPEKPPMLNSRYDLLKEKNV